MSGKLRPVGSRVPLPTSSVMSLPWERYYVAEYTASGTDALAMAVSIAVAGNNRVEQPEVIIPGYGCPDLVAAILALDATPVLVDLLPDTPFMDDTLVRKSITDATVAVVGVGFLGIPERLSLLAEICREKSIFLIEDSAQCFPPFSTEKPLADLVVLSFGRGKPINLMGGGALLYRKNFSGEFRDVLLQFPKLPQPIGWRWYLKRFIFNLLLTRYGFWILEKLPFMDVGRTRFNELKSISRLDLSLSLLYAGIRDYWFRPLPHQRYTRELQFLEQQGWQLLDTRTFGEFGLADSSPRIRFGVLAPDMVTRNKVWEALNSSGIGANALYEVALPYIDGVDQTLIGTDFPVAHDFASRLLTLPCHCDVTDSDITRVVDVLKGESAV